MFSRIRTEFHFVLRLCCARDVYDLAWNAVCSAYGNQYFYAAVFGMRIYGNVCGVAEDSKIYD